MNTRIQVEHPVTEVRFDIDLVEAQMKIAMGYSLSDVFKDPYPKGHAIEFRINAEDSADNFRPSPGRIDCWSIPQMAGIRCDHAVYQGYEVPPYYDSLIAKVVIHAHTRTEVLEKARQFFCAFVCTGVSTTQVFHQWMLEQPDFVSGDYSTTWLDRHLEPKNGEMALV
jgi:acetyl-CoA carboxylase biotin carboxylase subunit